jgi:lipoate-protein ligase A
MDLQRLQRVLSPEGSHRKKGSRELAASVGWLNRWLSEPVTIEEVEERLIAVFSDSLGIAFTEEDLTPAEWSGAHLLMQEKYPNLAE